MLDIIYRVMCACYSVHGIKVDNGKKYVFHMAAKKAFQSVVSLLFFMCYGVAKSECSE